MGSAESQGSGGLIAWSKKAASEKIAIKAASFINDKERL
jgi:hypothetical protein